MHDLITLPSEIIHSILSYLEQYDHVECMLVCHRWHDLIPAYTLKLWHHLLVAFDSWPKTNERLLQCLGPHIEYLTILDEAPPSHVLNILKDKECNLTVLEIACYGNFSISSGRILVAAVAQFGTTLKEIHITGFTIPDLPEHQLLDGCPNLTHLTLLLATTGMDKQPQEDTNRVNTDTKLLYLRIDNGINFEDRVMDVLRRSPKLKSLVMSNHYHRTFRDTYLTGVHFYNALSVCTNLRYVSWNERKDSAIDTVRYESWMELVNCNDQDDTAFLTELVFRGANDDITAIIPILQSQLKLEYMKLTSNERGVCPFASMTRSHLKELYLEAKVNGEEWAPFLMGCPILDSFTVDTQLKATDIISIIQGVHSLKNLKHLHLHGFMKFNIYSHLPTNIFGMLSTGNLRTLSFRDIPISDAGLLVLCKILSLETLSLSMPSCKELVTTDGFLAFAEKLQLVHSQLVMLSLFWFTNLTDTVLERLSQLRCLDLLVVSQSKQVTDVGVRALTSRNKKIIVHGCPKVTESYA